MRPLLQLPSLPSAGWVRFSVSLGGNPRNIVLPTALTWRTSPRSGEKYADRSVNKPFDRFRAHPWHGLSAGPDAPAIVDAYIEITPFDAVKYEIDKKTGYLRVDRPQGSSALPPTLYGFVPRTYCAERVAKLTPGSTQGDMDPLDICVLSEQRIDRAEVVVPVRVVGGIQLLDGGEADDKIVATLSSDVIYDPVAELTDLPPAVVSRLVHYFATYKMDPHRPETNKIRVVGTYGVEQAHKVITAAMADYAEAFPRT